MLYFNPHKVIVVRAEASYHDGVSAGLFQDVGKRASTSTFHQPYHDRHRKTLQSDRKRCISSTVGKKQIQDVFTRSAQIQNHYGPQTSAVNV